MFQLEVPNVFTVPGHKLPYLIFIYLFIGIIWKEQKIIKAQFNTISKAYLEHSQHFGFIYYSRMFNWLYIQYSIHLWAQKHSYINCDTKIFHSKSLKSKVISCWLYREPGQNVIYFIPHFSLKKNRNKPIEF